MHELTHSSEEGYEESCIKLLERNRLYCSRFNSCQVSRYIGGNSDEFGSICSTCLFMISGYFAYSTRKDNYNLLKRRARKILKITLWSSFFFLVCKLLFVIKDRELDLWLSQVLTWQTWIGLFILNDFDFIKAGHLWFLPALLYAYVILYFIDKQRGYLFFYKLLPWLFLLLLSIGVYI